MRAGLKAVLKVMLGTARNAAAFDRQMDRLAELMPVNAKEPQAMAYCYACNEYGWPDCLHKHPEEDGNGS